MERSQVLARLRAKVAEGRPVIGGGAGTGISAKSAEAGGIDLLVIYNSGRFRMAGRGSLSGLLAYGDANAIVMEMANEDSPASRTSRPSGSSTASSARTSRRRGWATTSSWR